jgi:Ca2+-binding EF-hand superfamily protein
MKNKAIKIRMLVSVLLTFSALSLAKDRDGTERKERHQRTIFATLDVNGDGAVPLDEFKQHSIRKKSHEDIFGHIDADGDGVITPEEFNSHKPPRRGKRIKRENQ